MIARDIAKATDSLEPDAPGAVAIERFRSSPSLNLIPVVLVGRPIGILTRERTFQKFTHQFGHEIWSKRPVRDLMSGEFAAFPDTMPIEQLLERIAALPQQTLLDGVVFVDAEGFYSGDASAHDLYKAAVAVTTIKNLELDARNEALGEAARSLALETDRAKAASQSKSEFLAAMSHEIRTPLNGVLGMAQSLQHADLPQSEMEKVNVILESGKSLLLLLNDVLDLSKIEAGKLEIAAVPADPRHTIERTCDLFQATAAEKGLTFETVIADDVPGVLIHDPLRVRQCLSNMISNAIKFTDRGRVRVAVSTEILADHECCLTIAVTDTGIGMGADVRSRLFQAFSQADSSTSRKYGGTGLGLAISRQLARLMGGDLSAASVEGKGSTFSLTIQAKAVAAEEGPVVRASAGAADLSPPASLFGRRILLTDDNAINRQVVRLFLAPLGCEIVEARNGQEALDKLAHEAFDLVLLDVHMPVMDGKEAIQRIRASETSWRAVPVIALTADAMIGDRERLLALGMTDYLPKPLDQRALISKMINLVNRGKLMVEPMAAAG